MGEAFTPSLSAAVIALFCRQYDIIKDNDSNNNKEKTKPSSEHSTPERPSGGLLRSKVRGGARCLPRSLPGQGLGLGERNTSAQALTTKPGG